MGARRASRKSRQGGEGCPINMFIGLFAATGSGAAMAKGHLYCPDLAAPIFLDSLDRLPCVELEGDVLFALGAARLAEGRFAFALAAGREEDYPVGSHF